MIKIQNDPINIEDIQREIKDDYSGADVIFLGTVRKTDESKKILRHFTMNHMMPWPKKASIKSLTMRKKKMYDINKVCVIQRKGYVRLNEISIGIGVSSFHRKDAFMACEYIIDKIKELPPIWKKDIYDDGTEEWKSEL
ncbi:molybdenum cofactor biosynthesis protein MoaE [Acidiplasma cupricumulans]|uniref:molybdenum cofactor biosynthesis protein MoaE n=1 Tax=Acidiplasma cupricumulans TaxID=312540 RepID=UPI000B154B66|nr:molybdenum cofactor biosynthesis protein MoaE [Acidiplasma cupricumulans]